MLVAKQSPLKKTKHWDISYFMFHLRNKVIQFRNTWRWVNYEFWLNYPFNNAHNNVKPNHWRIWEATVSFYLSGWICARNYFCQPKQPCRLSAAFVHEKTQKWRMLNSTKKLSGNLTHTHVSFQRSGWEPSLDSLNGFWSGFHPHLHDRVRVCNKWRPTICISDDTPQT